MSYVRLMGQVQCIIDNTLITLITDQRVAEVDHYLVHAASFPSPIVHQIAYVYDLVKLSNIGLATKMLVQSNAFHSASCSASLPW
jgi:hypothetical protein